jgi:hypothetical protein
MQDKITQGHPWEERDWCHDHSQIVSEGEDLAIDETLSSVHDNDPCSNYQHHGLQEIRHRHTGTRFGNWLLVMCRNLL